jgi:hypothetical protein
MANFWHPGAPLALPDSSKLLWLYHIIPEKRERERWLEKVAEIIKFGLIRDELSRMQVVGGLVGKLRTWSKEYYLVQ